MVQLISTQDITTKKLASQDSPKIVFADFDGTLFSPNLGIVKAPFINRKTSQLLSAHNIPFVVVTGRSEWGAVDRRQFGLTGFALPDTVITANGTIMYHLLSNKLYARDMEWEARMQYSKVKWGDGEIESWNKLDITSVLKDYFTTLKYPVTFGTGNTFLIRIRALNIPVSKLNPIRKDILTLFPSGLRVVYTEKLLKTNTLTTFSGEILITPSPAGKDNAVKYLLEKYAKQLANNSLFMVNGMKEEGRKKVINNQVSNRTIHALIFGDATVDMPMLMLKSNPTYYHLSQFLVHPTPLARKAADNAKKTNPHLQILPGDGPGEILKVVKALSPSSGFDLVEGESRSFPNVILSEARPSPKRGSPLREESHFPNRHSELGSGSQLPVITKEETKQSTFSPAQNNPIRQGIKKFEPLLDRLVDKNLSPNEISFLGLKKLSEGLEQIYTKPNSPLHKIKGLYNYGFGNLTDVLDGIRARQLSRHSELDSESHSIHTSKLITPNDIPGQLVDGFSDRAKEFMQLFTRAKNRQHSVIARSETTKQSHSMNRHSELDSESQAKAIQTFLTALSCALPSIARAQVEITSKTVSERDEKGGSMIDRTKKLSYSLLLDTLGAHKKSEAIDKEIYSSNLATFQNRLSVILNKSERDPFVIARSKTTKQSLSDFQKKALERWLLYIDVLQQEDSIIKKCLSKHPKLLKEYEKDSQKLAKDYLLMNISQLRKKWKIKDYKLQIKNFLL